MKIIGQKGLKPSGWINDELIGFFHRRPISLDVPIDLWQEFLDRDDLPIYDAELRRVDIIGKVMENITDSLIDDGERSKLIRKLLDGWKVRILILHADVRAAKIRKEEEAYLSGAVGARIRPGLEQAIKYILEQITGEANGTFKFGVYGITPFCSITRVGDMMQVTDYLYRAVGNLSPTFLLQKGHAEGPFSRYMYHFEHVWHANENIDFFEHVWRELFEEMCKASGVTDKLEELWAAFEKVWRPGETMVYSLDQDGKLALKPVT